LTDPADCPRILSIDANERIPGFVLKLLVGFKDFRPTTGGEFPANFIESSLGLGTLTA